MEYFAALLLTVVAGHPGHGDPEDHPHGVTPTGVEIHTPAFHLAATLLDRGQPAAAARLVAHDAETSAEAARILADALSKLGDGVGARLALSRAERLSGRGASAPQAPAASPPAPSPRAVAPNPVRSGRVEEPGQPLRGGVGIGRPRDPDGRR